MVKFVSGINSNTSKPANAMKTATSNAVTKVRSYYSSFYSAGSYLVTGFKNGISENTFRAEATAKAMAEAALEAAKEALKEHSPSKAMYEVGDYAGQGFVNGLDAYEDKSYDSGYMMADYARQGLAKAIAKVQSLANSEMDIQPTIAPVVDLSGVTKGSNAIAAMLDQNTTIGASVSLAGVNSISATMSRNRQNGGFDDVVTAIDKLRKDLSNIGGSSYTINGVTYDDGSAISGAIESIVRAARLERRM